VFLLGIFTKKANHFGALTGLFVGIVMVAYIQTFTSVSYLIHTAIGVITCMIAGYMLSFITKTNEKDISGLTVWSLNLKK
jgi:Na+/proline symporter